MATIANDLVSRAGVKGTVLKSTVANGTAPLQVQSSTVVTNLNADQLDGYQATAFALASGKLNQFAATTSAELAEVISDETGTGSLVFGTSPAITTSLTTGSTSFDLLNTNATTINFGGAATTLNVGASAGTVVIKGNLTVDGTTNTINSTTVTVDDKNLELGSVATPTDVTADGGGITLKGATDKTWNWASSTSSWTSSENIDLASGKVLKINGVQVLSATTYTGKAASADDLTGGTTGSLPYQNAAGDTIFLAPNTGTKQFLTMTSSSPSWAGIVNGDVPTALSGKTYNGLSLTANATGFSVAGGTTSKTLTINNSITIAGTDGTTITLPSSTGTVALDNQSFYIGTTSVAINRSSGALTLNDVSVSGSAGSISGTNHVIDSKGVTVNANSTPTALDSWSVATYTSAKYVLQLKQNTKVTSSEVLVMWDGTDVQITEFAVVDASAGAANASVTASYSGGNVSLTVSSSDAATTNVVCKASVTYVKS